MPAQRSNGLPVPREGIAVFRAHDYGPDGPSLFARGWKHRGRKPVALCIAQGQEHRHDALKVRFEPNVTLEGGPGGRDISCPTGLRASRYTKPAAPPSGSRPKLP